MSKPAVPSEDTSPRIPQRDKLKQLITIKELNWTEKQKQFIKLALDKNTKVLLVNGPAGSSKTLISVYCALRLLNDRRISDILYVRSPVESADRSLGYLPGDLEEKLKFYNLPLFDKLEELLKHSDIQSLEKENRVSMFPLGFSRGMHWNAKCIIADETQNFTLKELVTLLTRIGQFSKCFILADPFQTDLTNGKVGGFEKIFNLLSDEESQTFGIQTFRFGDEDIMRSEVVRFLVKKFKELS